MPRPTTAQVGYGSLTVVLSTIAMLLLSGARSGAGVVAVAAAGLVLGLLVALVLQNGRRPAAAASASAEPASVPEPALGLPRARVPGPASTRVSEHSLRR